MAGKNSKKQQKALEAQQAKGADWAGAIERELSQKSMDKLDASLNVHMGSLSRYNALSLVENEISEKRIKKLQKLKKAVEEEIKLNEKLFRQGEEKEALMKKQNDKLEYYNELLEEEKDRTEINLRNLRKYGVATMAQITAKKLLGKSYDAVLMAAEAYKFILKKLIQVHERVFKWQNQIQASLSTLAKRFGSTTDAIVEMRDEGLKQLMDTNGLGGLGMSLEDITAGLGDFAEAMVWTNRTTQQQAAEMIKWGTGVHMNAQQVGELTKAMMQQGQTLQDVKDYMFDLAKQAKLAGVSTTALSKQFQGAGKALFELSGPSARKQLVATARELAKIGTGLDKLAGFIDMTMSFDQTVESMAKLNTAFGTHINAMDMFMEQDPSKQFDKITDALLNQGKSLDGLSRSEKKYLMDVTKMDAETIDAMLNRKNMTDAERDSLDKMAQLSANKLKSEKDYEKSLMRSKSMLIAEQAVTANINNMLTKGMVPFYDGFAKGGGLLGGAEMFNSYVENWTKKINSFGEKLGQAGLGGYMLNIGRTFGHMWDVITDFITSGAVATFLSGVMATFDVISDVIMGVVDFIAPVLKLAVWLIGKILQVINPILKLVSAAIKFLGGAAGATMDFVGDAIFDPANAEKNLQNKASEGFSQFADGVSNSFGGAASAIDGKDRTSKNISDAMVIVPTPHAQGGPVAASSPYLVGEQGPELFTPSSSGNITPAAQTAKMMGGGGSSEMAEIHVHVTLDSEKLQDTMYKASLRRHQ
jgi:hypothetical protein